MKDTITYPLSAIMGEDKESSIDQLKSELSKAQAEIVRLKAKAHAELAEAIAKERERCARVCEEILHPDESAKIEERANWYAGTWACAAAIKRGE